jgi:hypothetical protein
MEEVEIPWRKRDEEQRQLAKLCTQVFSVS